MQHRWQDTACVHACVCVCVCRLQLRVASDLSLISFYQECEWYSTVCFSHFGDGVFECSRGHTPQGWWSFIGNMSTMYQWKLCGPKWSVITGYGVLMRDDGLLSWHVLASMTALETNKSSLWIKTWICKAKHFLFMIQNIVYQMMLCSIVCFLCKHRRHVWAVFKHVLLNCTNTLKLSHA